jgi:AraC-like DNA-binding protein
MQHPTLSIPGQPKLSHMDMKPEYFYRRSCGLYGVSGTGKSTILDNIMLSLKPFIPNVIVFNPTGDVAQSALQHRVPGGTISTDPQIQQVVDIFKRQQQATRLYDNVNKLENLKRVFDICNSYTSKEFAANITRKAFIQITKIQKARISFKEQTDQIESIKATKNKYLADVYKNTIRKHKDRLLNTDIHQLTEIDKFVIVYLDFCPDLLLVTDDAAVWIKDNQKHESIKNVFYQGRHYNITCIHCVQDDKILVPSIRKNIYVSIFTEVSCAMTFFKTEANGIPKSMRKQSEAIAEEVFKGSDMPGNSNFKKLVFNRLSMDGSKFQYYVADPNLNYKFGCSALWDLWDKAPKKQNTSILKKDNPFYQSFAL